MIVYLEVYRGRKSDPAQETIYRGKKGPFRALGVWGGERQRERYYSLLFSRCKTWLESLLKKTEFLKSHGNPASALKLYFIDYAMTGVPISLLHPAAPLPQAIPHHQSHPWVLCRLFAASFPVLCFTPQGYSVTACVGSWGPAPLHLSPPPSHLATAETLSIPMALSLFLLA